MEELKEIIWLWCECSGPARSWPRVRIRTVSIHLQMLSTCPSTGAEHSSSRYTPPPASGILLAEQPSALEKHDHTSPSSCAFYSELATPFPTCQHTPWKRQIWVFASFFPSLEEWLWDPRTSGKRRLPPKGAADPNAKDLDRAESWRWSLEMKLISRNALLSLHVPLSVVMVYASTTSWVPHCGSEGPEILCRRTCGWFWAQVLRLWVTVEKSWR